MSREAITSKSYKMYYGEKKERVYAPQISKEACFVIRRIAWALGKPMTACLNEVVAAVLPHLKVGAICAACKDKQCAVCPFQTHVPGVTKLSQLLNE